jgi:hypothetical protein
MNWRPARPARRSQLTRRGGRASTARRRQGRRSRSDLQPSSRGVFFGSGRCGLRRRYAGRAEGDFADGPGGPLRYTASANSVAAYAYSDDYLIHLKHAVIMDVEATTAIRQAEVGAAKAMLDRTAEQFDVTRRA